MVTEKQHKESAPPAIPTENGSEKTSYFLAEVSFIFRNIIIAYLTERKRLSISNIYVLSQVIHPFSAASEKELDLDKGDYIVVRKVHIFLLVSKN